MNAPISLLYVEDDLQSREIMQVLVQDVMGISSLTIFENSQDFVQRMQNLPRRPDLIMLDIHVPPHNGFEMLAMLRDQPEFAQVPVVALTASVMNEEVERLQASGFDGVIAKPVDLDTFPLTLEAILDGKRVWHVIT